MSADKSTSWSYAEDLPAEDDVLLRARERSFELGVKPISPGVGAVLTVLAAASKAQTVVEVGSGAGVSGVCLLRGLGPQAVLTTIDVDVEHLKAAREAFLESGSPANRTRTISGIKRVSKPGLRVYAKADSLPRVLGGLGVAVVSTSQGLMTDREARKSRMGGEVLCFVW